MNPALRFGAQQEAKLRTAGNLKRSRTNSTSDTHSPVNLPAWDHSATAIRMFQGGQASESMAFAKPAHMAANRQLSVCEERKDVAVVSSRGPESNEMRGCIARTQPVGAIAGVLNCNTV